MSDKSPVLISGKKVGETAIVQLRLHDLSQLFNLMDPSPFIDKDLDADAEAFIEGWALEFPVNMPITLVVHLEQTPVLGGPDPRRFTELAVRNFFHSKADTTRRELRQLMKTGQISLIIGMAFMALCLTLSKGIAREFPPQNGCGKAWRWAAGLRCGNPSTSISMAGGLSCAVCGFTGK